MLRKSILLLALFSVQSSYANLPYYPLQFPRDEGAHYSNIPYSYDKLIEWWYFNGELTTDEGKHLSYDVAMFHGSKKFIGVVSVPVLHMQVSDLDQQKAYGAQVRYSMNTGSFSTTDLDITVNQDYKLTKTTLNGKEIYVLQAQITQNNTTIKMNLMLEPESTPFLINSTGLMPMPNNVNSYYYTIPHFNTSGTIEVNDNTYHINNTPGDSWMDHQWGDFTAQNAGWEWFGVRLRNGLIANIFLDIDYKNANVVGGLANVILPNGDKRFVDYTQMEVTHENDWFDSKLQINYPTVFHINIPSLNLYIDNTAAFAEQEVNGYWEGYCNVKAKLDSQLVDGFSYTELVYVSPAQIL